MNFSYVKSICLIAAYIAGSNKDAIDNRLFLKQASGKLRRPNKTVDTKIQVSGQNLLGKTKKFPVERFFGIADYLLSI